MGTRQTRLDRKVNEKAQRDDGRAANKRIKAWQKQRAGQTGRRKISVRLWKEERAEEQEEEQKEEQGLVLRGSGPQWKKMIRPRAAGRKPFPRSGGSGAHSLSGDLFAMSPRATPGEDAAEGEGKKRKIKGGGKR